MAIPPFARATVERRDLVKRLDLPQQRQLLREILKVEDPPDRVWLAVSMQ